MAVSDFVRDIAELIKEKSGVDFNIAEESTKATEEWIPRDQLSRMTDISLRTAEQTQNGKPMKLKQFNPSYFLNERETFHCRMPGCSETTFQHEPTRSFKTTKQDLFLCKTHSRKLMNLVSRRCAKENVTVNVANYKDEDFNGYTSLIGILERAFTELKKGSYQHYSNFTDCVVLAEVFLNTRNFLNITNALLNPDKDNEKTAVGSILGLLQQILASPLDRLCLLTVLLVEVMCIVLTFFGIVFTWVKLQDPIAKLGAGLGLAIGFSSAVLKAVSPWMTLVFSVVGTFSGYLIGSGVYGLTHPEELRLHHALILKHQEMVFKHFEKRLAGVRTLFLVKGNDDGKLSVEAKKNLV